jgi:tellurite resistance protein TehA-like permease
MKKTISFYFLTVVGVGLLATGLYFIKTIEDPQGLLRVLPFICFGLGCAIFGHGIGEIIVRHAMNNSPASAKQLEIDRKDERNLTIANRAKAKTYDIFYWFLSICFSLYTTLIIITSTIKRCNSLLVGSVIVEKTIICTFHCSFFSYLPFSPLFSELLYKNSCTSLVEQGRSI